MSEPSPSVNSYLETEKISKLMRKYAVPCVISLLVAALYNIVDQLFIANASYLGSYGNAANTVVYPMTVIAFAFASMIGDGCCAFVSISMGQNEKERANRSVGSAIVLSVIVGIVLMMLYFAFMEPILTFFGGRVNEETFAFSKEYFTWIAVGVPFYVFGQAINPIIRSDGSPKFAMVSTLVGCVINIILDPLFIYGFHWGMMGAAVATILGQIATAIMGVWYIFHFKVIELDRSSFKIDARLTGKYLSLGMCSFLAQFSIVVSMAAIQNMVVKYGAMDEIFGQAQYSQIPMAVLGIVMKFFQIVISIALGMAAGCIPVIGYNFGAGQKKRTRELMVRLIAYEAIMGAVALFIVEVLPRQLIGMFGAASESEYYTTYAIRCFRIYLCMTVMACVNKGMFTYLQAMGKAMGSMLLSLMREIVFGTGFALTLPLIFGLDGVLYSMPVSDFLTFLIALVIIRRTWKELSA